MPRLLFEKTGNAVYISHLDLMRLFQRAFKRARLPLTHTHGYNPRPSVSIALPLSLGVDSVCELLDFDLEGEAVACDEILERLNPALVPGVRVREVYKEGRKIKHLAFLDCVVTLEYDDGIPVQGKERLQELFGRESLVVEKKNKNGVSDQDIIPMIRQLDILEAGKKELVLKARVCCQNPTLNPMQMVSAIERYMPEMKPNFARCSRLEIYDTEEKIFR